MDKNWLYYVLKAAVQDDMELVRMYVQDQIARDDRNFTVYLATSCERPKRMKPLPWQPTWNTVDYLYRVQRAAIKALASMA